MNDAQFNRLPEYAKSEITMLREHNKKLKDELNQFNGGQDSPIRRLLGIRETQPIPDGTIRFDVGNSHIDIRVERSHLEVNASNDLRIQPRSTNLVELVVKS